MDFVSELIMFGLLKLLLVPQLWRVELVSAEFHTTLEGPFKPVSVPLDKKTYHGNAIDLPHNDPQLQKSVEGFEPDQISVSLSTNYDSVWISWVTGDFQIGDDITPLDPESVSSVVHYGIDGSRLSHVAIGYSFVYNQLYPYEDLQNYSSGIIHHVQLTGTVNIDSVQNLHPRAYSKIACLRPSTLYQYQCGDPSIPALSDVFYFKTMPVSNSKNFPSRVAVLGDLGLTYNTSATLSQLLSNHPDLLLLVGGVSYADMYLTNGTASTYSCEFPQTPIHETYQPRWDYWGRFMQPLLANVPVMVVGGKHEIERVDEDQIFVAYSYRFGFHYQESGSSSSTVFYSFNAGGIHFVVLNPYVYYDKSSDQYNWLENDLYNIDRNVTPWLAIAWYPSWYSTFKAQYREAECMRAEMEDLLYYYGVDVVFNGHVHAYERSNRIYNYSLDPCGPVYITIGTGGSREDMAIIHADDPDNCPEPFTTPDEDIGEFCVFNFTSGPAAGQFCWDEQPEYSAFRESSFGHGILEVKNETHALWSWHRNQDSYEIAGDIIYLVREPDRCLNNKR